MNNKDVQVFSRYCKGTWDDAAPLVLAIVRRVAAGYVLAFEKENPA